MKWLSDFVDCSDIDIKKYCDRMTDTGSKVEGYELLGEEIENVRVGLIKKIEQHPDAERLVICQVDIGNRTIQIVTAAKMFSRALMFPLPSPPRERKL